MILRMAQKNSSLRSGRWLLRGSRLSGRWVSGILGTARVVGGSSRRVIRRGAVVWRGRIAGRSISVRGVGVRVARGRRRKGRSITMRRRIAAWHRRVATGPVRRRWRIASVTAIRVATVAAAWRSVPGVATGRRSVAAWVASRSTVRRRRRRRARRSVRRWSTSLAAGEVFPDRVHQVLGERPCRLKLLLSLCTDRQMEWQLRFWAVVDAGASAT
mmetsp:Transcript_30473/g.65474  ORF Transcript_30473/g.65474 Transcript_30473/m.65474 type:complete len:215 (-) Transcript_30473:954-1598(-)